MSDADGKIIHRLNVIIVLLLVPYVIGAVLLLRDAFVPLLVVGFGLFLLLFALAMAWTFE